MRFILSNNFQQIILHLGYVVTLNSIISTLLYNALENSKNIAVI